MDENTAAGLFFSFFLFGLVVLLIVLADGKKSTSTAYWISRIIDWWTSLCDFQLYDYGDYGYNNTINNNGGARGLNYNNWNTPSYRDVWVQNYVKQKDGTYEMITVKMDVFVNVNGAHEWGWLQEQGKYGWKCPKPPAEPSMFMTSGAVEEVQAILDEYNANKITADTFKPIDIAAKSPKSVEIDENNQQNAENG